jgi:hypothetical protein
LILNKKLGRFSHAINFGDDEDYNLPTFRYQLTSTFRKGDIFSFFSSKQSPYKTFSFGSLVPFQYKAVVLIEECPKTFCNTGKGIPKFA